LGIKGSEHLKESAYIKAWFKSKTADRVLLPVREVIVNLIDRDSSALDVGCGTGDLLFKVSNKIRFGLGVDMDRSMINFANKRKDKKKVSNLEFMCEDFSTPELLSDRHFDVSTSTLCLHEMTEKAAVSTLRLMAKHSSRIIIADFLKPKMYWGKVSIEVDEFFSGHYDRFKNYRKNGGLLYLAELAGVKVLSEISSPIDGIGVWVLSK